MLTGLTGIAGQLKVANQVAAELGAWSMAPGEVPGTKTVTAATVSVDRFLVAQDPDTLVLCVGASRLRWTIRSLEVGDGTLRCSVAGAPR